GHRMIATTVGFLTIILAVWLYRADDRPWMRRLGFAALGAVIVQGILGGLTVLYLLPKWVSASHACLAQIFFSTTVTIPPFTSRPYCGPPGSRPPPAPWLLVRPSSSAARSSPPGPPATKPSTPSGTSLAPSSSPPPSSSSPSLLC